MKTKGFINRLAEWISNQEEEARKDALLILPSRRAIVFLQEALIQKLEAGAWMPQMIVIDQFLSDYGRCTTADPFTLLFELYKAHRSLNEKPGTFDEFLKWGHQVLADFNDIDKYLIDAKELFDHVHEAKKLEAWSPDSSPTEMMVNFASFYQGLGDLYREFTKNILDQNLGHQGLVLRMVAEDIESITTTLAERFQSVWWAGFNALNPAEIKILKGIQSNLNLKVFWDVDEHYLRPEQEAGKFLRDLIKAFPNALETASDFSEPKTMIDLPCPKAIVQTTAAVAQVDDLLKKGVAPNEIAVVLADEQVLEPFLNQLPEKVEKINVTMGYPIKLSLQYRLIKRALIGFRNAVNKTGSEKAPLYYHRDVTNLLENPLLSGQTWRSNCVDDIKRMNKPYLTTSFFEEIIGEESPFFPKTPDVSKFLKGLGLWLSDWVEAEMEKPNPDDFALESATQVGQMLNRLIDLSEAYGAWITVDSAHLLWLQLGRMHQISFIGEPLEGLQVMGVLETRLLNFDHVILVGANEGTLPAARSDSPFIPLDIKYFYGLPSFDYKEAVFAYHVYRLAQHASYMAFLYNTDGGSGGEPSRYLRQMRFELPYHYKQVVWKHLPFEMSPMVKRPDHLEIEMSPEHEAKLSQYLTGRGMSPSAINTLNECSIRFFFQYLAEFYEEDEVTEDIEASTFGTYVHEALDICLTPLKGRLKSSDLLKIRNQPQEILAQAEEALKMDKAQVQASHNKLQLRHAEEQFLGFLDQEIEFVSDHEVDFLGGEEKLEHLMAFGKLQGRADRIDCVDGVYRVVDYKTGAVDANAVKITDLEKSDNKSKAWQLLAYLILVNANREVYGIPAKAPLSASIGALKSSKEHYVNFQWMGNEVFQPNEIDEMEEAFKEKVLRLLDLDRFTRTEELSKCTYCPFIKTCLRKPVEH